MRRSPEALERHREYQREYRKRHPERVKASKKKWIAENPEKHAAIKRRNRKAQGTEGRWREELASSLRRHYGLTVDDYYAMLEVQGNACAICKQPNLQIDKRNGRARRLHVDHDHATGKVRALLCNNCNTAIGHAKEDPARLRALADYLEGHRGT